MVYTHNGTEDNIKHITLAYFNKLFEKNNAHKLRTKTDNSKQNT